MGRTKHDRKRQRKASGSGKQCNHGAAVRPMQGMDQKSFRLNDIVPISIPTPSNSTQYIVTVSADVNGWTWQIQTPTGLGVAASTGLYGQRTGQFATQASFYSQYYMDNLEVDLVLSSGGSTYSMSPMVTQVNPNGQNPFVFAPGGAEYAEQLSAAQNVEIHNPYMRQKQHLNYERWLVAMSNRAWRQTINVGGTGRELYPTDGTVTDQDELFKLPTLVKSFVVTIPENTFAAGVGRFLIGVLELKARYKFSQRRTDINDLLDERIKYIKQHDEPSEVDRHVKTYPKFDVPEQKNGIAQAKHAYGGGHTHRIG